ncbi:MAG TPA: DUF2892 domain-containing protein [Symbiobacteriaceae bacterium]|nr:DUF2892 domain-containing protein [Symbiobacteriaceae bacterium]
MMEQNVGMADRYVRITLGSMLLACAAARGARQMTTGVFLTGALGGMMLAEGVLGTCMVYSALGVNTLRGHEQQQVQSGGMAEPYMHDTNDVIQPYEGI